MHLRKEIPENPDNATTLIYPVCVASSTQDYSIEKRRKVRHKLYPNPSDQYGIGCENLLTKEKPTSISRLLFAVDVMCVLALIHQHRPKPLF